MALNILIVDDSALTRRAIRRTIEMTGIEVREVLEAGNGAEALEVLKEVDIDLVLADLNMPEMNGMEMIDHINRKSESRHVPVIVVSTESSRERIAKLLADGAEDYLHKPFTPEQFRDVLVRTVGAPSHD